MKRHLSGLFVCPRALAALCQTCLQRRAQKPAAPDGRREPTPPYGRPPDLNGIGTSGFRP